VLRELCLLAGATPLALLGEGDVEPLPVDPDAVFGRQLDRQVDQEAKHIIKPKHNIAQQN